MGYSIVLCIHRFNILKTMFWIMNQGSIAVALEAKRKIVLVPHAFPFYTYNRPYFTDVVSIWSMYSRAVVILTTRHLFHVALFWSPGWILWKASSHSSCPRLSWPLCRCLIQGSFLILYLDLWSSTVLVQTTHCLYRKPDFESIHQRFIPSTQQCCGSCLTVLPTGKESSYHDLQHWRLYA